MTISDTLRELTTTAFLNTDIFGKTITHWIGGDPNNTESVIAIVDLKEEMGRSGAPGEGRGADDRTGIRRQHWARLSLNTDVVVVDEVTIFEIDGERWTVDRVEGRDMDGGMQDVWCKRATHASSRQAVPRP